MSDPAASISTGLENIMISSDPPETSEHRTTIQHDEHIARLTQKIEDLRGELNRVRDLTNLSITLQSPPPEPRNVTPNPPRFPSLESPVPEHFPPQNNTPTNNNFLPITPANPSSVYTPPQSQPPTHTTYATPNPPPVNPPSQSLVHTSYVPLSTNTNPPPTTTPLNPPNQLPINTTYNKPPPIQNTPTVQTYPTQHIQGAYFVTPNAQYVPPVYAAEIQAFTN
ncbi:proline-rich receptor-like protein kinase PERK2 [Lycium ferocissimum]|uniref:proline-rich receptor-like protein kinase PERK2 n=1 Tax=Lycium ferocissimum TaxID=112874 RepID=UPI00281602F7|nr:proline-rich receptor-like protein kinase PERK2 [Lycium ferocissimum]